MNKTSRLQWLLIILFCLGASNLSANNLSVSNVTTTGQNTASHYTYVQFDISWDNSWRDAVNWDAAWVFIKYKTSDGLWHHATLNSSGHTAPTGSTIEISSDRKGVFIYRSSDGTGSFSETGVQLRWNYGTNGVADNETVTIKVFAIEMVYVPTASYKLGDDNILSSLVHIVSTSPVSINTNLVVVRTNSLVNNGDDAQAYTNGIGIDGDGGIDTDNNGSIDNADYPTGYEAFYCMRYEITQEQYADFLNTLTYDQQTARTANAPSSSAGTGALVSGTPLNNNSIEIMTPGVSNTTPAVYGCDFNNNGTFNESGDGQNIACNYINCSDGLAYADWAGLRPMTELEFEKACRGDQSQVGNEYAWGTSSINTTDFTISSQGSADENISSGYSISSGNANTTNQTVSGPLRAGIFADNILNSSRVTAGATYYGIMEMSGNLEEKCVTLGTSTGRSFSGRHGDGALDASGNFNAPGWTAGMLGRRGGSFATSTFALQVSDRTYASKIDDTRKSSYGYRCVR
jgi:formylglycine-generating enzyme required for sulfatase activity